MGYGRDFIVTIHDTGIGRLVVLLGSDKVADITRQSNGSYEVEIERPLSRTRLASMAGQIAPAEFSTRHAAIGYVMEEILLYMTPDLGDD